MTSSNDSAQSHEVLPNSFEALFVAELEELGIHATRGNGDDHLLVASADANSEGFVRRVPENLVGLALSGGGIRSATFNLGFLQSLERNSVLEKFHYLSTVSGGGYVGSWWSAYRKRHADRRFPCSQNDQEAAEVRHLREFSGHLVPRWGVFAVETWQFAASIVIAALPTLVIAGAVLTLALGLLLVVAGFASVASNASLGIATALLVALVLVVSEWRIGRREGSKSEIVDAWPGYAIAGGLACLVVGLSAAKLASPALALPTEPFEVADALSFAAPSLGRVRALASADRLVALCRLLKPAAGLAFALVSMILLRTLASHWFASTRASIQRAAADRVIGRLLAMAIAWFVLCVVLVLPAWKDDARVILDERVAAAGGISAIALFLVQRWLSASPKSVALGGFASLLRSLLPQLLAYLAVLAAAFVVTDLLRQLSLGKDASAFVVLLGVAVCVILLTLVAVAPNEIGLHSFYRARLARSYLGASSRSEARSNRHVTEQSADDIRLDEMQAGKPIHLLCCAANDVGGDTLGSLSRGARSAVLSRFGVAWADQFRPWTKERGVTLASAMTASAAAFNSNMGALSMRFGRVTAFVLTALNARLGLWVPVNTEGRISHWLSGTPLFRELIAQTRADPDSPALHLSDGGHFDNLGLYELLRRHCRFIVVCDCTADPEVAFDDLGNAIRHAREDFGIEINLDVSPLKPDASGLSRQHVAVGDVLYPNRDRGVILLVKPTLVGDEPDDVSQYRRRNDDFPHETTTDQFYDGAQWESYRRLGQHAGNTIFGFMEAAPQKYDDAADLFAEVRFQWYPAPDSLERALFEQTRELREIDAALAQIEATAVNRGVWPEIPSSAPFLTDDPAILATVLPLFTRMIQLFENVYVSCDLERYWGHPANLGWMNLFGRWATSPLFRLWWPILAPMYGRDPVRFAARQFGLNCLAEIDSRLSADAADAGVATQVFEQIYDRTPGPEVFRYVVVLRDKDQTKQLAIPVEVALACVRRVEDRIEWNAADFFVPPSFWGSGIGSQFLRSLLQHMAESAGEHAKWLRVTLAQAHSPDQHKEQADLTLMYRKEGFRPMPQEDSTAETVVLQRPRVLPSRATERR